MTSSPALVALAAAAAWFLVFLFLHIGGLRAGFENARWLLISYAACFLGTLGTAILVTAWHHGVQAVIPTPHLGVFNTTLLVSLLVSPLHTLVTFPSGSSHKP